MKKIFKFLGILILIIIIILAAAPVLFKGKIVETANAQLEQNLNAKASFEDISLSLFRNFPNLSIKLNGLVVAGIDEFEGDTLINLKSLNLVVDVVSAIKMENIEVKQILLDQPKINAIVLEDGKANWDIAPESEETEVEEVDTTTSDFDTKITLKLFKIANANIYYTDKSSGMAASLEDFTFTLSGDMSQDYTALIIDSKTEKLNFTMDGIRYTKDVLLQMHFDVGANLKESIFTLEENSVSLNELALMFSGSVEMPESGDILTNVKFATNNASFKTLLSLVPAIYMQDFEDLQTTGNLKLEGLVEGAVTETTTPDVDLSLLVSNATFKYPDLPKSANDIQIDVDVHYDGQLMDNTTVDVNKFHVDLGGNNIDMVLNLRNPDSDPFTNGKLTVDIDLSTLSDVVPLPETELTGKIFADLDWMGNLSTIENEEYEKFKADGGITISGLYYNSPDLPRPVTINSALVNFSPQKVSLRKFDMKLGASDFQLTGELTNFIPYALDDKTIRGELTLNSNLLDANEFLTEESPVEEPEPETESAPMTVIEVPANIDFRLTSSLRQINYEDLVITNLEGLIIIKDQVVDMRNLSMNMLDGSFKLSGEYNTKDINNPIAKFDFQATDVNIPKAAEAFDVVGEMAPVVKKADGNVTIGMNFTTFLTQDMKPVLSSMVGSGNVGSSKVGITNPSAFKALGQALNTDAFNNLALEDFYIEFEIIDGTIFVEPFEASMGDVDMMISGEQTFSNTLNYNVNLNAPRELLGLENSAVNELYNKAATKGLNIEKAETVNLLAKITGPINDPKVSIDLKDNLKKSAENIKEELKETATKAIEEKKEEVKADAKAKAREEADKILKEAEEQAANIKAEGKKAADAVRYEANANAEKLIKEAGSNPLKKAAAEATAKKVREEGEKKARQIESEANTKADKVVKEAKAKADETLK